MVGKSLLSLGAVVFALLGLYFIYADILRSDLESACTQTVIGSMSGDASHRGGVLLGYVADYAYVVDGNGYRGHDQLSTSPGGSSAVVVHYDPGSPVRSVLELGRWRVILYWGVACLGLALVILLVIAVAFPRRK